MQKLPHRFPTLLYNMYNNNYIISSCFQVQSKNRLERFLGFITVKKVPSLCTFDKKSNVIENIIPDAIIPFWKCNVILFSPLKPSDCNFYKHADTFLNTRCCFR